MSDRPWQQRVRDMLDTLAEIQQFCADLSYEQFRTDAKTQKAVSADLAILGEAARHIPEQVVNNHPEVPWHLMRGMRNRVIHAYFAVDPQIVWETVQNDLPPLVGQLQEVLAKNP